MSTTRLALATLVATTLPCPTCGEQTLDLDTTQLPKGATHFHARETVVIGCPCCGFSAEHRPDGLVLLDVGVREAGFDKQTFRRRMAALVALTPEAVRGEAPMASGATTFSLTGR